MTERQAEVWLKDQQVGMLTETDEGYRFQYFPAYVQMAEAEAVSFTLPLRAAPYASETMFSFFDGLIPEGWLLDLATRSWKINRGDRMGLLLAVCRETIGAVSIRPAS